MSTTVAINAPSGAAIETHYVNSYQRGIEMVFQKAESILQPYVKVVPQNSEEQYYDRIGAMEELVPNKTRYDTNPHAEIAFDRRRSVLDEWHQGHMFEDKDLRRVAEDPSNEIVQSLIMAAVRKKDDIIMDGIFAPAHTGKKGEVIVNWAADGSTAFSGKIKVGEISKGLRDPITTSGHYVLQAGNYEGVVVSHDYVETGTASSSGLTIAKLIAYKRALIRLEVLNPQDNITLLIGEQQWSELLNTEEVKNSDYNIKQSLAAGNVTTFMGYTFVPYIGLPTGTSGSDKYRRCIALPSTNTKIGTRNGIYLAMSLPINSSMWRLPERRNIPYAYVSMSSNAFRMWGEMVGEIRCTE